jgi:hypothetical protein
MRLIRLRKLLAFAFWELRRTIIAISRKEWAWTLIVLFKSTTLA